MFFTIFCFVYLKMLVFFMSNRARVICGKYMLSPSVRPSVWHTHNPSHQLCCLSLPLSFSCCLLFIYLDIDYCRQAGPQAQEPQEIWLLLSLAVPALSVNTCCFQPLLYLFLGNSANSILCLSWSLVSSSLPSWVMI